MLSIQIPKILPGRVFIALASFILFLAAVPELPFCAEFEIYGKIEQFTWKEYDGGSKLLEESGPVFTAGCAADFSPARTLILKLTGEMFTGSIDYDGQTWDGDPVTTDTDYLGVKLEADLGREMTVARKYSITPFAGIGTRIWDRKIQSALFWDEEDHVTKTATGYTETWRNYYARTGILFSRPFNGQWRGFSTAGLKMSIYTKNTIDSLELEPGNRLSGFAEAGIESRRLRISIFYEGLRFSKSNLVHLYDNLYAYQPKSKADIFGITAGVKF